MAGIGFELKKIISSNSVGSFFKASISGIFIVSGPWLLSILSLSVISFMKKFNQGVVLDQFFAIHVYIYSISFLMTGGFQYIMVRIFSDYIYKDLVSRALYIIIVYLIFTAIISFILPFIAVEIFIGLNHSNINLVLSISYQAVMINMLWIILIFVSILKWYLKILFSFLVGLLVMIILLFLNRSSDINVLINCYASGNAITFIGLLYISTKRFFPSKIPLYKVFKIFVSYLKRYKYLFFTGFLYYLAFWLDKICYWYFFGSTLGPFSLKLYPKYDISIYIGNLSIIPGMVYYIIVTETIFFIKIKKFIISLSLSDYKTIIDNRNSLLVSANKSLGNQFLIQSLLTLFLSLISYLIAPEYTSTLIITLWAVNLQLIVFTNINFLFYMERYKHTFFVTLAMTLISISTFIIINLFLKINIPGLVYLISTIFGVVISSKLFIWNVKRLDRFIYTNK